MPASIWPPKTTTLPVLSSDIEIAAKSAGMFSFQITPQLATQSLLHSSSSTWLPSSHCSPMFI